MEYWNLFLTYPTTLGLQKKLEQKLGDNLHSNIGT